MSGAEDSDDGSKATRKSGSGEEMEEDEELQLDENAAVVNPSDKEDEESGEDSKASKKSGSGSGEETDEEVTKHDEASEADSKASNKSGVGDEMEVDGETQSREDNDGNVNSGNDNGTTDNNQNAVLPVAAARKTRGKPEMVTERLKRRLNAEALVSSVNQNTKAKRILRLGGTHDAKSPGSVNDASTEADDEENGDKKPAAKNINNNDGDDETLEEDDDDEASPSKKASSLAKRVKKERTNTDQSHNGRVASAAFLCIVLPVGDKKSEVRGTTTNPDIGVPFQEAFDMHVVHHQFDFLRLNEIPEMLDPRYYGCERLSNKEADEYPAESSICLPTKQLAFLQHWFPL